MNIRATLAQWALRALKAEMPTLIPGSGESFSGGSGKLSPTDLPSLRSAYELIPVVFAAVHAIAANAASVPITVWRRRKSGSAEQIRDHEIEALLHPLVGKFNVEQDSFSGQERTFADGEIAGIAAWRLGAIGPMAPPRFIEVLRPDLLEVKFDRNGQIDHYEMRKPDHSGSSRLEKWEVITFPCYSPTHILHGTSPIAVAKSHLLIDLHVTGLSQRFYESGGTFGGTIIFKDSAGPKDVASFMEKFNHELKTRSGGRWRGLAKVDRLEPDGSAKNADPSFGSQRKLTREEVLMAMGVPPVMVTILDGATYQNAEAQIRIFWQNTEKPKLALRDARINAFLAPRYGDGYFIRSDFSGIEALLPTAEVVRAGVDSAFRAGLITKGEGRRWLVTRLTPELGPTADDDLTYQDLNVNVLPLTGEPAPSQPSREIATPRPSRVAGDPVADLLHEVEETARQERSSRVEVKQRVRDAVVAAHLQVQAKAWRKIFRAQKAALLANVDLLRYFGGQEGMNGILDLYLAGSTPTTKRQEAEDLLLVRSVAEIDGVLEGLRSSSEEVVAAALQKLVQQFGAAAVAALGLDLDKYLISDNALRFIANTAAKKVVLVNRHSADLIREEIRKALLDAQLEGVNIVEAAGKIMERVIGDSFDQFGRARAVKIAQTETNAAYSFSDVDAWRQTGQVLTKTWATMRDDRVRTAPYSHEDADGQEVALNSSFNVGGEALDHPGDPAGSAANVIECRCTMLPGIDVKDSFAEIQSAIAVLSGRPKAPDSEG